MAKPTMTELLRLIDGLRSTGGHQADDAQWEELDSSGMGMEELSR